MMSQVSKPYEDPVRLKLKSRLCPTVEYEITPMPKMVYVVTTHGYTQLCSLKRAVNHKTGST